MEKLEGTIKEMMDEDGKSEEEIFEMVNKILIKTRKVKMQMVDKKERDDQYSIYYYRIPHVMRKLNKKMYK